MQDINQTPTEKKATEGQTKCWKFSTNIYATTYGEAIELLRDMLVDKEGILDFQAEDVSE